MTSRAEEAIETLRTTLRPFAQSDAEAAFAWFGNAEVMRFSATGPDGTIAETRERIAKYRDHQILRGFSKWLIMEKDSGEAIGDAGLLVLEELGAVPDLGFRLVPSRWRQGFAAEVAAAWVRVAFNTHGLDQLGAFAHVDNLASHRVLEKVGFRRGQRKTVMGMDSFTYLLVRQ